MILNRLFLCVHALSWIEIAPADQRQRELLWGGGEHWPGRTKACRELDLVLRQKMQRLIRDIAGNEDEAFLIPAHRPEGQPRADRVCPRPPGPSLPGMPSRRRPRREPAHSGSRIQPRAGGGPGGGHRGARSPGFRVRAGGLGAIQGVGGGSRPAARRRRVPLRSCNGGVRDLRRQLGRLRRYLSHPDGACVRTGAGHAAALRAEQPRLEPAVAGRGPDPAEPGPGRSGAVVHLPQSLPRDRWRRRRARTCAGAT